MRDLTDAEKYVLDRIQEGIPFTDTPFEDIGAGLSLSGSDVISIIKQNSSLVRNISAIFNADALGYRTTLAAFSCSASSLQGTADYISRSPCVSHNYLRDDSRYRIWFTLAVPAPHEPAAVAAKMAEACGVTDYLVLDSVSRLKIGVHFPFTDAVETAQVKPVQRDLTDAEKDAVIILQDDLPLEMRPFDILARRHGIDEQTLIECAVHLKNDGIIRRYAAILRHREAGFAANAMTAWQDPGEKISAFRNERAISHLYFRKAVHGQWSHPLFAMIHAHTDEELSGTVRRLSAESGIADFRVLRSEQEFKKERVHYYSPAVGTWLCSLEKTND
ncbi:MAG: hypothetical protein ACRCUT_05760 [Spirochaetota bacterium]